MNNEGKMSLGSFVFKINPRMIKISSRRNVVTRDIPYSGSKRTDLGSRGRLIQISGELCGSEAAADFERLRKIFDRGQARILYIPSQKPILALPKVLSLVGEDIEGVIGLRNRRKRTVPSNCIPLGTGQLLFGIFPMSRG